jgi:hypothetical protein
MSELRQSRWIFVILVPWAITALIAWVTWPTFWNIGTGVAAFVARRLEIP